MVVQADGKVIIGGRFTLVNGEPRAGLARLNRDGSLDTTFGVDLDVFGDVTALVIEGDHLYVGGRFDFVGQVRRSHLARLILSEGGRVDPTWDNSVNGNNGVGALAMDAGHLYVGGDFTKIGGVARRHLARISLASGLVDHGWTADVSRGDRLAIPVACLQVDGPWLYVGGVFNAIGGKVRKSLARVALAGKGTVDAGWRLDVRAEHISIAAVNAISVEGATVFINAYLQIRVPASRPAGTLITQPLVKFQTDAQGHLVRVPEWVPPDNVDVGLRSLVRVGNTLIVPGRIGGQPFKIDVDSGLVDADWVPRISGSVGFVAVDGGQVYAGGNFETVNGSVHLSVARLRGDNGRGDPTFNAQAGDTGDVKALAEQPDGKILVGGDFSFVGNVPRRHLLRLNGDGSLDPLWNPDVSGDVSTIAVAGDSIFIAGTFDTVGGQPRLALAKLSATGSDEPDPAWRADCLGNPSTTGVSPATPKQIATDGIHLYVSGYFATIGGVQRSGLARVSLTGTGVVDPLWAPVLPFTSLQSTAYPGTFALGSESLFIAASYPVDPDKVLRKVSLQGTGAVDPLWKPKVGVLPEGYNGPVSALALQGQDLFVGGYFTQIAGKTRKGLAKISTMGSGVVDSAWDAKLGLSAGYYPPSPEITTLRVNGDVIYAAGSFDRVDGQVVRDVIGVDASTGALRRSYGYFTASLPSTLLPRGNDLLVAGPFIKEGDFYHPTKSGLVLAPIALAPVLTGDANDPYTFYIAPNAADGSEVTHFQLQVDAVLGGQMFLPDGVTPVPSESFVTREQGRAGLKFVPATGSQGAGTVVALAGVNATSEGLGSESSTLTLSSTINVPIFELSSDHYSVRERDGAVVITVLNRNGLAGQVAYTLTDQTARAGIDFDAAASNGVLDFTAGQTSRTITVPITDNGIATGDRVFLVTLSSTAAAPNRFASRSLVANGSSIAAAPASPPLGIVGLRSGAEVVIFDSDFAGGRTGSLLEVVAPSPAPSALGTISLALNPATPGQWRLVGDFVCRESGATMTGLTRGNFDIEFRSALGFRDVPPIPVALQSGTHYSEAVDYAPLSAPPQPGDFTVTLRPNYLATASDIAQRAQWRREGEATWHDSGEVVPGIDEGVYTIEFKHLDGFDEPTPLLAVIGANQLSAVSVNYRLAETQSGAAPAALTFAETTNRPFEFGGQVQTGRGFGSGFVVDTRTVLTAAHVLFDDEALGYVPTVRWLFQKTRGEFEPEPLTPRGWYVFEGYAAQRLGDRTDRAFEANEASPESRHLDAAALYFFTDTQAPGRGGYGGFLISDTDENEWLTSARAKRLSGYPMEGVAEDARGRMHATPELSGALSRVNGRVFRTSEYHGLAGMSGGPLLVSADDAQFYPAAIFLHSGGETFVRAIDSDVLGLINRAQTSASSGGNSASGGITVVSPNFTTTRFAPCQLRVLLRTPGGTPMLQGGWIVEGLRSYQPTDTTVTLNEPKHYIVRFLPVDGFATPPPIEVALADHQLTTRSTIYHVGYKYTLTSADQKQGTVGPSLYEQAANATATAQQGAVATVFARPNKDYAFDHWTDGSGATVSFAAKYQFPATTNRTLVAYFQPGPFIPYRGSYEGLIGLITMNGPGTNPDGGFTLNLDGGGRYTGIVKLQGKRYAIKGRFSENGSATYALNTTPPLVVELKIDLENGTNQIKVIFRDGDAELAQSSLNLATPFDGKTPQTTTPLKGSYTFAIPHRATQGVPQGDGYGTVVVDAKGRARAAGKLGDGTAFAAGARLVSRSQFSLFAPLYGKLGAVAGLFTFDDAPPGSDITAPFAWSRPTLRDGTPALQTSLILSGSRYASPAFDFSAATFSVSGGALTPPVPVKSITLDPAKNRGSGVAGDGFSIRVAPATGLLSGSFLDPTGKPRPFFGALLQKSRTGQGFFRGPAGQLGSFELIAIP